MTTMARKECSYGAEKLSPRLRTRIYATEIGIRHGRNNVRMMFEVKEVKEEMKSLEVKEVNEVIATLEVLGRAKRQSRAIDDTLAGETTSRTNVVNFDNFDNFDNFSSNFDNFGNFDNFKKERKKKQIKL